MKVTYLIGNGFDIQYGLKTRFTDFYDGVVQNKVNSDNIIYEDILKTFKKSNDKNKPYENWADCEKQIGQFSIKRYKNLDEGEKIPEEEQIRFVTDVEIVEKNLTTYLQKEQNSIKVDDEVYQLFYDEIVNISDGLPGDFKDSIDEIVQNSENIIFNFINFNYTDVFDRIIDKVPESYYFNTLSKSIYRSEPIHIHGTINDFAIVGVNDRAQISEHFDNEYADMLIKIKSLEYAGHKMKKDTERILDDSNLIIIFGMSLGETDKYWWQFIAKQILSNNTKLIIHWHQDGINLSSHIEQIKLTREIRAKFWDYTEGLSDDDKNILRENIYVTFNRHLLYGSQFVIRKETKEISQNSSNN